MYLKVVLFMIENVKVFVNYTLMYVLCPYIIKGVYSGKCVCIVKFHIAS
jgi:hypothetical protein